jgi:hypothetical protein
VCSIVDAGSEMMHVVAKIQDQLGPDPRSRPLADFPRGIRPGGVRLSQSASLKVSYVLLKVLRFIPLVGLFCVPAIAAPQDPIPSDTVISVQRPIPPDTVISLQRERGNCDLNDCPIYRVLIFADGDVIWHGRLRVAKPGVFLSHIQPDQIRALIQDFESIDFFHLENIYGFRGSGCQSSAPDMSTVFISLSMGGLSKTLWHHDGCIGEVSEKLTALENSIDQAVDAARWISAKPRAKKR